jgi:hypothetical protein
MGANTVAGVKAGVAQSQGHMWHADAAILLVLAAAWAGYVAHVTGGHRMVLYDTFRDMAWAENIRAGRIWADPALPNQPYWYAPGNPLLMAGIATVTRLPVVDVYGYSALWCNALIPLLLYLLVWVAWDRMTAIIAVPAVFLGSYWWLSHAVAAIPAIQGVALNLAGLWAWHRCVLTSSSAGADGPDSRRTTWTWPLLAGLILSLCTWYHPLCGIMLAGAIFLHAVFNAAVPAASRATASHRARTRFALVQRMAVIAAVAAALTGPLIVHMLALQTRNPAAIRYFSPELTKPEYYAHARTPLLVPCALLGVWRIARKQPQALWIVAYLFVGLVGQGAGYLGRWPDSHVPFLLPHEFQWHGQLAAGVCGAVGIASLARTLADRAPWAPWAPSARRRKITSALYAALLGALVVGPGLRGLADADRYLIDLDRLLAETRDVRTWIVANTSLDAVFVCPSETAYRIVSGMTGRKCIVLPTHQINPGVDLHQRRADVSTMLETDDPQVFAALARRYDATHLLVMSDSPNATQAARARYAAWPCLEPAFAAPDGRSTIYRVRRL